jgi:hypothetical protein
MGQGMTRADIRALKACMEIAKRDPMRERQLECMRKDDKRPWEERALFACSCVQSEQMSLRPWETVPADAVGERHPTIARLDSQTREWRKAHAVVERLLKLDLSPYVADPLGEIRRAEEALRLQAHPPLHVVSSDGEPPASA